MPDKQHLVLTFYEEAQTLLMCVQFHQSINYNSDTSACKGSAVELFNDFLFYCDNSRGSWHSEQCCYIVMQFIVIYIYIYIRYFFVGDWFLLPLFCVRRVVVPILCRIACVSDIMRCYHFAVINNLMFLQPSLNSIEIEHLISKFLFTIVFVVLAALFSY